MSQEAFFAKQEDRFASFSNLLKHLTKIQGVQQNILLSGINRRQKSALIPMHDCGLRIPSAQDWRSYLIDLGQRQVLFWDALRQRGDNLLHDAQAGYPIQLKFTYETILDGRTLSNPVNYSLLHIIPTDTEQPVNNSLPPIIVIDPRGGHSSGIGGFKEESTIGESVRAGHPTYFIAFSHAPEPGQTLEDVTHALAYFIERVTQLHPEVDKPNKPVIIGNCQAGWAAMGLAAIHPQLPGLLIINGAPLSYWAGANGQNPMRYAGGLLGGAWLTRLSSDLGNGRFDGAWLASNFEQLDPANTYWEKYYHLFRHIDTESTRFLDFERWWSNPILLNSEEIETIVDDLFIGNELANSPQRCRCSSVDLRHVEAPIVIFCSDGDNITPPQQALNWIADLYPTDLALHAAKRVIIYLRHTSVGHLGLFVSSQVARREHRQMIGVIDAIRALPPGLYELLVDDDPKDHHHYDGYSVHFEPRHIADIRNLNTGAEDSINDEREFELVDQVSELNNSLYEWTVRPWLRQAVNEPSAHIMRHLHPFRQERLLWSSLNPALWWLPQTAQKIAEKRQPLTPANPILVWQDLYAKAWEDTLDTWRDWRDAGYELSFHSFYGFLSTWTGSKKFDQRKPSTATERPEDQQLIAQLHDALPKGGRIEATMRILLLLAQASGKLDKEMLQRVLADFRAEIRNNAQTLSVESLRQTGYIQHLLVFAYPQESLRNLPLLLPELSERVRVMEAVLHQAQSDWQTHEGVLGNLWRTLYTELELPIPDFARELKATEATEATEQPEDLEKPLSSIVAGDQNTPIEAAATPQANTSAKLNARKTPRTPTTRRSRTRAKPLTTPPSDSDI